MNIKNKEKKQMKTEENISITEESKKQDKQDHFSDEEDSNDSFQVKVNFIKNKTITSNFNFNIEITKESRDRNKSQKNSRRNTRLSLKDFLESHQEIFPNLKEQNYKKSKNKIPKPKMNKMEKIQKKKILLKMKKKIKKIKMKKKKKNH